MAGDFYKQFFIVGLLIFLVPMVSTELTCGPLVIESSLDSISIRVPTKNDSFNVTVIDAYTNDQIRIFSVPDSNKIEYPITIGNLSSGLLLKVQVDYSGNDVCIQNISTSPNPVENLKVVNISFTSAHVKWNEYKTNQTQAQPEYEIHYENSKSLQHEIIKETYKNILDLLPHTEYNFSVSVLLHNTSSKNQTITFTTLTVPKPKGITIVALNTSTLKVTWIINSTTINPKYVRIISGNTNSTCNYLNGSCAITVGQKPGKNHTLNIFSGVGEHTSQKEEKIHPTKPRPPKCIDYSTSTSLTIVCHPNKSEFDYYIINGQYYPWQSNVTYSLTGLNPKTSYEITFSSLSGTESSENITKMFFTNPSLDETKIVVKENSVIVTWPENEFQSCDMFCLYNSYIPDCKNISGNNVTFDNVRAGMVYFLNVSCNRKWSTPKQFISPPLPPTNVNILAKTDSIELTWEYNYTQSNVEFWNITINGTIYEIAGNNTKCKIGNLLSGTNYKISIWSSAANETSSQLTKSISTFPECRTTLSKVSFTNSSITLKLSESNNSFDHYIFILQYGNGTEENQTFPKEDTTVELSSLVAGVEYNISVKTKSGKLESTQCESTIIARTRPNAPTVNCTPSERNIHVDLSKGPGNIDGFEVSCDWYQNFITKRINSRTNTSLNIKNLKPNEIYLITVNTFAGDLKSENVTCNSTTEEGAPSKVQDLKVEENAKNVVDLTWKKPKEENGYIRWYIIEFNGTEVGTNKSHSESFNTSNEYYKLQVKPGYSYSIMVTAFTVMQGPSESINFTSKTYAPRLNSNLTEEMQKPNKFNEVSQHSITVEFLKNPFTQENGRILNYTVIVATSNKFDKNQQSVLPNWYQFNTNSSINAYQVISNCTDLYKANNTCNKTNQMNRSRIKRSAETQSVKFKIGLNDCSKENTSYCNGYLKPNTKYYVKVRAYTQDAFQDTPFSEAIQTENRVTGFPSFAIALTVICPLVTLIIAVLAFYMVRRKSLPKTSKVEKNSTSFGMSRCKPTSHPVKLGDFQNHIHKMSSDSDFRFAEEYEDLKDVGRNQEIIAAQIMCNRGKNRFANILPYDHSRVKLNSVDDEEGSDYINANYLPGFNSRREYIVTQGPLCSTRDDFWRMISEQNVHNIVMLTKCIEKLREKCDQYWPESGGPIFYGDVQVVRLHETITPDWTITDFKITLGKKSRNLRHFHFTSWPDFGVPNSPQMLINFVETVRRGLIKKGPIVVHCSAGVGRSGTFIAVDHCLQHIQVNDFVDVLGVVYEMRKQRLLMVQTEQQYIYIHHCLLSALEATESEDIYQNVIINKNGGHDNQAFLEDEGIHVAD